MQSARNCAGDRRRRRAGTDCSPTDGCIVGCIRRRWAAPEHSIPCSRVPRASSRVTWILRSERDCTSDSRDTSVRQTEHCRRLRAVRRWSRRRPPYRGRQRQPGGHVGCAAAHTPETSDMPHLKQSRRVLARPRRFMSLPARPDLSCRLFRRDVECAAAVRNQEW